MDRGKDLAGMRFGKLVAIAETDERKYRQAIWQCKCDCGNYHKVSRGALISGLTRSCGCTKHIPRREDLTGQQFERLTALSVAEITDNNHLAVWNCQCSCGTICQVLAENLKSGNTKSCGCLRKEKSGKNIINARKANTIPNALKRTAPNKNNKTSGIKGVCWHSNKKKWAASLSFQGRRYYLGLYDNVEDAALARKKAEEKYYKPFLEALEENEP